MDVTSLTMFLTVFRPLIGLHKRMKYRMKREDMTPPLSIEEIHSQLLRILQVIHEFCVAHGIRYTLYGGTLIGAIRHNGFIPWDDDADISMPRPDYERFIKEFSDLEGYRLFSVERKNCYLMYSRVCEMKETRMISKIGWTKDTAGIGVDIFPLDGITDADAKNFSPMVATASTLVSRSFRLRRNVSLLSLRRWIKHTFFINYFYLKNWQEWKTLVLRGDYDTTSFCANLANPVANENELIETSWISELVLHRFEDAEFFVPKQYDRVLTRLFGDYMKLPPEAERKTHTRQQQIVWRV